jgi:hypothetical protein
MINLKLASFILSVTVLSACGTKSDDTEASTADDDTPTDTTAATTQKLSTGTLLLDYALTAMSSTTADTASSLRLAEGGQSAEYPRCDNNGAAWDSVASERMRPQNSKFAAENFYCQLNFPSSPETVLGSLLQNKRILCDMERVLGTLQYTEAGKAYADTAIQPTIGCGWTQDSVDEMAEANLKGTVTATILTTGEWDKKLAIEVPNVMSFTIYMRARDGIVSFKQVESWSQAERSQSMKLLGNSQPYVAADAAGTRGTVITIDLKNGVLRGEVGDTYWGRRTRLLASGSLNQETGKFTELSEIHAIQGNFDKSGDDPSAPAQLYAEYATISGTKASGFKTHSYRFKCTGQSCNFGSTLAGAVEVDSANSSTSCFPASAACTGNTGLTLDPSADLGYLVLGASWDNNGNSRTAFQNWLKDAAPLTFTSISKASVID